MKDEKKYLILINDSCYNEGLKSPLPPFSREVVKFSLFGRKSPDFPPLEKGDKGGFKNLVSRVFAYFLIILIFLCLVSSVESYILSVSHLPQLQKGYAFLLITDLSGVGPSVDVSFYDESGKEASIIRKLLPPKGKIQISVRDHLKSSGSIVVESSNEVILAEYWQIYKDGTISVLPLQLSDGEDRYLLNCFRFPSYDESYITICDPKGTGPMVQMEFYSKSGELVKIARKMLRPHGILTFKTGDYASKDVIGKVSVRSFGGSITLYTIYLCSKKTVFALPIPTPSRDFIVEEFSSSKGVNSGIIILDASAKGTRVKISLLDDRDGTINSFERSLSANSAIFLDLSEFADNIENGIIKINSESEIIVNYWEEDLRTGDLMFDTACDDPKPSARYSYNILSTSYLSFQDNANFIISILNIGQESVVAEIEIYNSEGERIGSKKISIKPYERFKESMNHYFGELRLGTIVVRDPNSSLIITSSIVNTKNGRLFGKIHAISR